MRLITLLIVSTLAACEPATVDPVTVDPDETDAPTALPPATLAPQLVAGCAVPEAGWSDEEAAAIAPIITAFSGVVVEVGAGLPPNRGCYTLPRGIGLCYAPADGMIWATVEDDTGAMWELALALQGTTLLVGDEIAVEYELAEASSEDSHVHGSLGVTWADGREAWVAVADTVEALAVPEGVEVALGDAVGSSESTCGGWTLHDAEVQAGGASGTFPYGGTLTLDGTTFVHGGLEQGDGSSSCPDWYIANVLIGATR